MTEILKTSLAAAIVEFRNSLIYHDTAPAFVLVSKMLDFIEHDRARLYADVEPGEVLSASDARVSRLLKQLVNTMRQHDHSSDRSAQLIQLHQIAASLLLSFNGDGVSSDRERRVGLCYVDNEHGRPANPLAAKFGISKLWFPLKGAIVVRKQSQTMLDVTAHDYDCLKPSASVNGDAVCWLSFSVEKEIESIQFELNHIEQYI